MPPIPPQAAAPAQPPGAVDAEQLGDTEGAGDQEGDQEGDEVCVRIELNTKTGQIMVGMEQPDSPDGAEESEESEDDSMQPAKDINDAMAQAKMLLESGGQSRNPNPQADEAAFSQGFKGAVSPDMLKSRGM